MVGEPRGILSSSLLPPSASPTVPKRPARTPAGLSVACEPRCDNDKGHRYAPLTRAPAIGRENLVFGRRVASVREPSGDSCGLVGPVAPFGGWWVAPGRLASGPRGQPASVRGVGTLPSVDTTP